jgi:SM-20-related protein
VSEPLLEVIDDLVPAELFQRACELCAGKGWYFGHSSHSGYGERFWKMDLDRVAAFDDIWQHVRARCEQATGAPLRVVRQYANGHTYGLGGRAHLDDARPGCFTLLYYPMSEWKDGWAGETVFYDEHGEIVLAVRPRPNRAVLFDSRLAHEGRPPSRQCAALRVTVAYKLERVETAPPETRQEDGPVTARETSREGALRRFSVRVSAARVAEVIEGQIGRLAQAVRLPGFRPGKVPADVVRQRYGDNARAEAIRRLGEEAAAMAAPRGTILGTVELESGDDGLTFAVEATWLADLPEPDWANLSFERLSAAASDLEALGLRARDLEDDLRQQVLDWIAESYAFPIFAGLVEREFATIWAQAQAQGAGEADAAGFREIAERRVRAGAVVAEFARRFGLAGSSVEGAVVAGILARSQVRGRTAGADELRGRFDV